MNYVILVAKNWPLLEIELVHNGIVGLTNWCLGITIKDVNETSGRNHRSNPSKNGINKGANVASSLTMYSIHLPMCIRYHINMGETKIDEPFDTNRKSLTSRCFGNNALEYLSTSLH